MTYQHNVLTAINPPRVTVALTEHQIHGWLRLIQFFVECVPPRALTDEQDLLDNLQSALSYLEQMTDG